MKPIPEATYNSIVSLLDTGLSSRQIGAQLGVHRTTVDNVRAKARPGMLKGQGGRPAKFAASNKRRLVRMIASGKVDNAVQATKELKNSIKVEVSAQTVRRVLKEAGLKAAVKQKKPRLLPRHIRQRLDFALRHQHWTVDDWKRVIFSDETKINRLGSDGRE
jgi:transposase